MASKSLPSFLVATVLASAAGRAQNPVLHVPQQFPTITRALQNAGPDDLVIVKAGIYNEDVRITQGVSLFAAGNVEVRGNLDIIPTGEGRVVLRGLEFRLNRTAVVDSGSVFVGCEDLTLRHSALFGVDVDGLQVRNGSSAVTLIRCDIRAAQFGRPDGGEALELEANTTVACYDCELRASEGSIAVSTGGVLAGNDGGDAVEVGNNSMFYASGCSLRAGDGGNGSTSSTGCAGGGDGGDALNILGGGSTVYLLDNQLTAGTAGVGPGGPCPSGVAGVAIANPLGATVVNHVGSARHFVASSVVLGGQPVNFTWDGLAGDVVTAGYNAGPFTVLPGVFSGALIVLATSNVLPLVTLGTTGTLTSAFPSPTYAPGMGRVFGAQSVFSDSASVFLGPASFTAVYN